MAPVHRFCLIRQAVHLNPGLNRVKQNCVWCLVEIPLTMFSNSVDDQYIGCSPDNLLKLGKLPVEEKYPKTWEKAKRHWDSLGQSVGSFNPIYGTAIVAYTIGDELYRKFNNATREAGKSQDSYDRYAFKDFHFLLTKALQAKSKGSCYQVFRGIRDIHFTVSDKAIVRFGQFASSSLNKRVAQNFSQDTFFSILTCHGVRIDDFSYKPNEEEVLIPPYEKFIVTGYSQTEKGVHITLESSGVFSHWNCGVLN
ncbi:NAD(P)(+)--arginine ADP-ribosyltransferase 2-like, partial [Pseudonaja textilis]|uniref:NAD(P)(+)--arginine ADP-ribosyltransferase 2-like n=1 Tax=Pseudonaja textilis TaxID=8673 RepID=UPI000EA910E4